MFASPMNTFPSLNNINCFGNYPFYCAICKQRFQTEKNFKRHNNSRKHLKQIEIIEGNLYRSGPNTRVNAEIDLLPNHVIESLITDLVNQVTEKDEFFKEIQLLEDNDLDVIAAPVPPNHRRLSPRWRMESNPIVYAPRPTTLRRIPATYPCLGCFQSLDSQEAFDEHMLKAHFNKSFGADGV